MNNITDNADKLWEDSYCPGCGKTIPECYSDCQLYEDWISDFTNPWFEPRRKPEEYACNPLENNPYTKKGAELKVC